MIKHDDTLENLLNDLLGPEQAKHVLNDSPDPTATSNNEDEDLPKKSLTPTAARNKKVKYGHPYSINANMTTRPKHPEPAKKELDTNTSESPSKMQRRLVSDIEKYCRPQQLSLYNPFDSGFKYNVLGLFNMPDVTNQGQPCIYTVLASLFPPAGPYKQKPYNTMLGANLFADVDFQRTSAKE